MPHRIVSVIWGIPGIDSMGDITFGTDINTDGMVNALYVPS